MDAISDEMKMRRFQVDLGIAGFLFIILLLLGLWQRQKWPGTAFLLSYNYVVWAVACGVVFAICCACIWSLLRQQQTLWLNLCEIIFILLFVHIAAVALTLLIDRGEDWSTLAWFTLIFMFVPALGSSVTVLAIFGIVGRLSRR
jgi:hypothetical protein